jgi:hypothetical protein
LLPLLPARQAVVAEQGNQRWDGEVGKSKVEIVGPPEILEQIVSCSRQPGGLGLQWALRVELLSPSLLLQQLR